MILAAAESGVRKSFRTYYSVGVVDFRKIAADHGASAQAARSNRGYFRMEPDVVDNIRLGSPIGVVEHCYLLVEHPLVAHPVLVPSMQVAKMVEDPVAFHHGEHLQDPAAFRLDVVHQDQRVPTSAAGGL